MNTISSYFNLPDNTLEGSIPTELNQMERVQLIDLSSNKFIGKISSILETCTSSACKPILQLSSRCNNTDLGQTNKHPNIEPLFQFSLVKFHHCLQLALVSGNSTSHLTTSAAHYPEEVFLLICQSNSSWAIIYVDHHWGFIVAALTKAKSRPRYFCCSCMCCLCDSIPHRVSEIIKIQLIISHEHRNLFSW